MVLRPVPPDATDCAGSGDRLHHGRSGEQVPAVRRPHQSSSSRAARLVAAVPCDGEALQREGGDRCRLFAAIGDRVHPRTASAASVRFGRNCGAYWRQCHGMAAGAKNWAVPTTATLSGRLGRRAASLPSPVLAGTPINSKSRRAAIANSSRERGQVVLGRVAPGCRRRLPGADECHERRLKGRR